jgi:uncharacterized protein YcfL
MGRILLPVLLLLSLLAGCSSIEESLSTEEAKQLVIEQHTKGRGTPEIVSIEVKNNAYIVEWENKDDLKGGTDKVTKDGTVIEIEAYFH